MTEARKCLGCGKEFIPKRDTRGKYCSLSCYWKTIENGNNAPCLMCGKPFRRPASQHHVYCSKECSNKALERKIEKICPVCGAKFQVPICYSDRYTVCSMKCRLAFTRYHDCDYCGKKFTIKNHKIRFCSLSCYRRYIGSNGGETTIEKRVREFLSGQNYTFEQESRLGRYSVDFYMPLYRLAIECDGSYWHRNKKRDYNKNRYLKKHGYKLLRLSENVITSGEYKQIVLSAISELAPVLI